MSAEDKVDGTSTEKPVDSAVSQNIPPVKLSNAVSTWTCDGPCRSSPNSYREIHFCRICNDTCFCQDCIVLAKEGKMPYRGCSPEHDWIQGYPLPEEVKALSAASVHDGFVELHQEWLSKLREQWAK